MSSFTVLLTVHGRESADYFDKSLYSIWNEQLLKPNCIVIIEDGPLSKELNLILYKWVKILKNNLKLVKNEKQRGLTSCLIEGITYCQTEYIARMDSDDISLSNRFKLQVDFLDNNPDVSIVGTNAAIIDQDGKVLSIRKMPTTHDSIIKKLPFFNPLIHPSVMMKKSIFEDNNNYPAISETSQDYAFWFLLASKGYHFKNIDNILINYRTKQRKNSVRYAFNELKVRIYGNRISKQPIYIYFLLPFLFLISLIPYSVSNKVKKSYKRLL